VDEMNIQNYIQKMRMPFSWSEKSFSKIDDSKLVYIIKSLFEHEIMNLFLNNVDIFEHRVDLGELKVDIVDGVVEIELPETIKNELRKYLGKEELNIKVKV